MRPARLAIAGLAALLLVLASATGGYLVGRTNPGLFFPVASKAADPSLDLDIFWQTWNFLNSEFYRQPLDRAAIVRGAVKGMLEATGDDSTGYLEPNSYRVATEDLGGAIEGIGAEVGQRDERVVIIAPHPGSPAERAGVRPGDVITAIDGEDATGLSLLEAVARIRGTKGTTVRLTVERVRDETTIDPASRDALLAALPALETALRANDPALAKVEAARVSDALRGLAGARVQLDFSIVRDTIVVAQVEQRMLDDGIGYIRLSQFARGISARFDDAVAELLRSQPRALVLDLRRNSGGFVDEAVAVASQFLPAGTLIFVEERAGEERREYRARGGGRATGVPLIALVDGGTASASEIVAAALRDHGRAQLVGGTTYGKGTEQLWHELADGSGVRITIARWLSPKGTWVQDEGIVPGEAVEDPDPAPPDLQLDRAIALLR